MLSIVAKWWIAPGNESEAVAALQDLAQQVEDQEPYTLIYQIHTTVLEGSRPPAPATEVVFLSAWANRDDFDKHLNGPVFKGWIGKNVHLFLTDDSGDLFVTGEFLDRQAGFIRATAGCI